MTTPMEQVINWFLHSKAERLHLVDLENLSGSGTLEADGVGQVCADYITETGARPTDAFLIAAGPQNRQAAFDGWRFGNPVFKFQKGKDGADQALLAMFGQFQALENFNHFFLATGDAGLASIAEKVVQKGVPFTLVTGRGRRSSRYKGYPSIQITKGE
jgi:hypothetical protein